MFQGATALSLDAKGRMVIPTRHRDALDQAAKGRLVLTAHPHRCLLLYPQPAWESIRERIAELSPQARRLLIGFAEELEIDSAGRVLVPPALRSHAGLEKDIWMIGQGNGFEVWSDAGWKRQQDEIFALGDKLLPPDLVL
ncbi:MAG: division/cell wall cluster transcriptional repressor MraZ [Candidatus Nitricoxidivorans perseverans]|uniref:Transcriptional regulator MraZ n=1 Tax=Candidatus Nitricoxidivorans perseverans TaxID=2975601 RepID=A0AA49FL08_9PROT|nr:MAG: division/cell wall cluster transcriptional repressor MraZ [Candidatus Nitricoxidivorans perseverans]